MEPRDVQRPPLPGIAYRLVVLIAALTAALLSPIHVVMPLGLVVIAPVATCLLIAVLGVMQGEQTSVVLEFGDLIAATAAIGLTGGIVSPFTVYLTAAPVDMASRGWVRRALLATALGATVLAVFTVRLPDSTPIAIDNIAVELAVPILVMLVGGIEVHNRDRAPLNRRDLAILDLLAENYSYKEIAVKHDTSVSTIKGEVARVYRRLGVNSRAEALGAAHKLGVIRKDRE